MFQLRASQFKPSIEEFEHCRLVLSIDGTHLYGKYKGTLMIAIGCDGNNQLFPLAFSIIEGENIDSWRWFLACIRNRVTQRTGICVISNRHPGIMAAISDPHLGWTASSAYHMICMRHLASNFMTRFKDKLLKNLVCRVALATTQRKFKKHMATIGRINSKAQQLPLTLSRHRQIPEFVFVAKNYSNPCCDKAITAIATKPLSLS